MIHKRILHKTTMQLRKYSLPAYSIKPRPTNLQLTLLDETASEDTKLLEFYVDTMLREEPTVQSAGLTHSTELKQYLRASLNKQHTLQLTDLQGGGVVGGASGGPISSSVLADIRAYADKEMQEERSRQLVHLWVSAIAESGVLNRIPTVWHISYLAIAPHMRKLGMARFLLSQHSRLATKLGFAAITLQSSCDGTDQMLQKAGFKNLRGESLTSYMENWLSRPHPDIKIMSRLLLVKKDYDTWFL